MDLIIQHGILRSSLHYATIRKRGFGDVCGAIASGIFFVEIIISELELNPIISRVSAQDL